MAVAAMVAGLLVAGPAPAYAADAVAGGQSVGDSLFPNQGNSGYDVSHYDLKLKADFVTAAASAAVGTSTVDTTTTITAATTGAPLKSYSFDFQGSTGNLDAATYNVDTVTVNGQPATFTRVEQSSTTAATADNHKLIVTPSAPVEGTFTTVVTAHGAPVIHFDTDGSAEGWNNTTDGATFVNQPVGAMTLFPNNNTPRDKATYTVSSDVPSMLKTSNYANAGGKPYPSAVAGNGELVSKTPNADGTRTTWVWDEKKQMASELMIVSIGRYDVYESDITLASGRTIHEWSFIDPAISVANQNTTQNARAQFKTLFDFYESKYGPYPGNSTGVVTDVVPSTINYALETQDRPFFPNSAGGSFNHEQAHQWWGDNVSPTDWNDITLNEGPATWVPLQFAYEGGGTSTTTTEQSVYNSWNTTSATSSTFTIPSAAMTNGNQLFGQQVYARGSMTLEALRTSIGVANYETLMRQYQLTYGGGQIAGRRTQAFENMAEAISGRDLTAFFQAWWYTSGKPAWPAKFNLNVAGPTANLQAGSAANYTLSVKNTGKVPIIAGGGAAPAFNGATVTFDASDILDDAAIGTLPDGVTRNGNTLTWSVPATALAATSNVVIPFTVNAAEGNGRLVGTTRAATLGSTCLECTATNITGRGPITPAVTAVTGTPTVGQTLTADTTGWAPGSSFTYQWFIDGNQVPGATNATYVVGPEAAGLTITVQVTGRLAGFNPTSAMSPATAAVARATQMAGTLPTITGTPKVGGTQLVASPGTWEPGTVYSFQWRANGTNITGATGPRYIPSVASQAGQTLDVVVTGTKAGFTTLSKTSAPTNTVAASDPLTSTPTPTFTGTPKVGAVFAPTFGAWDDGTVLTFQWQANGANIATGGTAGSFTPTSAQLGQTLTLTVTGTKPGVPAVVRTSAVSDAVAAGTQTLQPTPSITGTPRANTASVGVQGTWDTGTTKTNKWYADGVEIAGATGTSYTPTIAQIGQVLTYEVTSTRPGYTTVVKTSEGKTIVGLAQTLTPTPTITGTPKVGITLTGARGTWDAGTTLTSQWLADGTAIAGATGTTFTPTAAELGKVITFQVTSTRATYETVTKTSEPTAPVAIGDQVLTPTPDVTGAPKVGQTLTVVPGTWDTGVVLSYQWYAAGDAISGATQTTYQPVIGDIGKVITVRVTGTKPGYTSVTKESRAGAPIEPGESTSTATPTISGTAKVGDTLTAEPGTWPATTTFTYQWFVNGTPRTGATQATFVPLPGDYGLAVTVKVTGSRVGYAPATRTSDPVTVVAGDLTTTPTPTISGTAMYLETLTAQVGPWDEGSTLAYQWLANGRPIAGATGTSYRIGLGELGQTITIQVTGTKPSYASSSRTSFATDPVSPKTFATDAKPKIKGKEKVGRKLTAKLASYPAGTHVAYSWYVGDELVGSGKKFRIPSSARGLKITLKINVTRPGYVAIVKTSKPTSKIA